MKKIYLGCSLTNARLEFRQEITGLKNLIKKDYTLLEFFSDPLTTHLQATNLELCQNIFEFDRKCVIDCDIMVAEVSYPSLGEGMELGFAVAKSYTCNC